MKLASKTPVLAALTVVCCLFTAVNRAAAGDGDAAAPATGKAGSQTGHDAQQGKAQKEDVLDRVFSPLDKAVDDINRDTNRDLERAFDKDGAQKTPGSDQ